MKLYDFITENEIDLNYFERFTITLHGKNRKVLNFVAINDNDILVYNKKISLENINIESCKFYNCLNYDFGEICREHLFLTLYCFIKHEDTHTPSLTLKFNLKKRKLYFIENLKPTLKREFKRI